MSNSWSIVSLLSDRKLDEGLRELARRERGITAELLAHLAEVDARRLCGGMAEGTTFNYCVRVLGFTEDEACQRIRVARTARKFPAIYDLVARGELRQTGVSRLAPLLTRENHGDLLEAARGKTIRELEHVIAERFPKPDAPTIVRRLPGRAAERVENGDTRLGNGATGRGSDAEGVAVGRAADDEGRRQSGRGQQQMLLGGAGVDGAASDHAAGARPLGQAEAATGGFSSTGFKTDAPGDSSATGPLSTSPQVASRPTGVVPAVSSYTPIRRGDRGSVAPLSPDRYRVQLTVSGATRDKLLRAQQLMRRTQPDGDLAVVVDRALSLLVAELEGRKFGKCNRPPKAVERAAGGTGEVAAEAAATAGVEESGTAPAEVAGNAVVEGPGKARAEVAGNAEVEAPEKAWAEVARNAGVEAAVDAAMEEGVEPATIVSSRGESVRRAATVENHRSPERSGGGAAREALGGVHQAELRLRASQPKDRLEPVSVVVSKRMNARQGATTRKRSRDVPRALRRAVDDRDGGRCTFVGPDGRRCEERGFLDFHHRVNYAWGGETTLANLTLHCPAHNLHLAIRDFGDAALRRTSRRKAKRESPPEG